MERQPDYRHPVFQNIELGIGTWAWGDRIMWGYGHDYSGSDLETAFEFCLHNGINFFDTAEIYGQGNSETLLGHMVKKFGRKVHIASKYMPFPWRLHRSALLKALKGSLHRLGVEKIDLYQLHYPIPPLTIESWMESMSEAQQQGLIDAIGISNCDRVQTQRAYDHLLHNGIRLASNQVEYHLLNRKIEKNGLLDFCQQAGITVIAYSPLAMGILSGKYSAENIPPGVRGSRYNRSYFEQIHPLLTLLKRIGSDRGGLAPAQVALNWIICKGVVPIPGVKNLRQAEQNTRAVGWRLTENEVILLDEVSERVIKS